jgi:hypothetical protein
MILPSAFYAFMLVIDCLRLFVLMLIQKLDQEDKQTIIRLIEKMLTNKKFKGFFKKNVAAL